MAKFKESLKAIGQRLAILLNTKRREEVVTEQSKQRYFN